MRLDKYLADCGLGSRKELKKLIRTGEVQVEGMKNPTPETHIDPQTAKVLFRGKALLWREFVYLLLNKPQGYLSATEDRRQKTVLDLVPEAYAHFDLFPVGRLDKDTEGLLILTNDGKLSHRLLSPKSHVPKTYEALIWGEVTEADVAAFQKGLVLEDGYEALPAELTVLKKGEESHIRVTIYEGKFHQVKRMFLSVGKEVKYLRRIAMNDLSLPEDLALGTLRELTEEEFLKLTKEESPC